MCPSFFHQRFNNRSFIEAGPQLGLIHKPIDIFEVEEFGGDLSYERDVRDEYKHIDAGLLGGVGYKLRKQTKSTSVGINYYYGLVNVSDRPRSENQELSHLFLCKNPNRSRKKV